MKKLILMAIVMLTLVSNITAKSWEYKASVSTKYQVKLPDINSVVKIGTNDYSSVITITLESVQIVNSNGVKFNQKILSSNMGENNEIILELPEDRFLFIEDNRKITMLNLKTGKVIVYYITAAKIKP